MYTVSEVFLWAAWESIRRYYWTGKITAKSDTGEMGMVTMELVQKRVEQRGFEIGDSVSMECYQNKLVILKD